MITRIQPESNVNIRQTSFFKYCRTEDVMLNHAEDTPKSLNYFCPETCGCADQYAYELNYRYMTKDLTTGELAAISCPWTCPPPDWHRSNWIEEQDDERYQYSWPREDS